MVPAFEETHSRLKKHQDLTNQEGLSLHIILAPNVLLEDHWIMNYDDHPYFT